MNELIADISESGEVKFRNREAWQRERTFYAGKTVKIGIDLLRKKRSIQQNKTVRGYWLPIVLEELGYRPHDAQYVYDMIKMKIGWTEERVNKTTGEVTLVPRPTADLDTKGYAGFMEIWRAFVEDADVGFGIILPDPDSTMARI